MLWARGEIDYSFVEIAFSVAPTESEFLKLLWWNFEIIFYLVLEIIFNPQKTIIQVLSSNLTLEFSTKL